MKTDLSIIILNYNGSDDTMECLESLDKQKTTFKYRIVVLDNDSKKENYEKLELYCKNRGDFKIDELESVNFSSGNDKWLIHSSENYGFARGNNEIIKRVMPESQYVCLLNNDTEVDKLFIQKMLCFLTENKSIKYASCRINNYYDKTLLWSCGGKLVFWGNRHGFTEKELSKKGKIVKTPYITGCALFLDTEMLKTYGMLSEDFFFGEEDFNFSWRMKKNRVKGACLNETLVYHKVSQSSRRSGISIGKTAGYYANRIIDMHKFYNPIIWIIWKEMLKIFVRYSCYKKGMKLTEIQDVICTISKYENNEKLTKQDCLEMRRF